MPLNQMTTDGQAQASANAMARNCFIQLAKLFKHRFVVLFSNANTGIFNFKRGGMLVLAHAQGDLGCSCVAGTVSG